MALLAMMFEDQSLTSDLSSYLNVLVEIIPPKNREQGHVEHTHIIPDSSSSSSV